MLSQIQVGITSMTDGDSDSPVDGINPHFMDLVEEDHPAEASSPRVVEALRGNAKLRLPVFMEVEKLAIALMKLATPGEDNMVVPTHVRSEIVAAYDALHDHDRSAVKFRKKYESQWGSTLFRRCNGPPSATSSAEQLLGIRGRHSQASLITE